MAAALQLPAARKFRQLKPPAVGTWRQAGRRLNRRRKNGIPIANLPTDLVGGSIGALEAAFRVLDAQALNILDWRKACGLTEAPLERASRQVPIGAPFPLPDWRFRNRVASHPARTLWWHRHDPSGPGRRCRAQALVVPLKRERAIVCAAVAPTCRDEIEHEVMPCHRGAGRDQLSRSPETTRTRSGCSGTFGKTLAKAST